MTTDIPTSTSPAGDAARERAEHTLERVRALQQENMQLHQAVRSHAVADQAIGVLIARGRLAPEQGWNVLVGTSQHTNIKLRHVAELVVEWARTGHLAGDIRTELERQLDRVRSPQPQG
jgi:hypothetical protein